MNYHFFIDEKFVNDFIADADRIGSGQHFIVLSAAPPKFVTSPQATFYANGQPELDRLVDGITEHDQLFIHWFTPSIMRIVDRIPSTTRVYLMFWGGDFQEINVPTGPDTQLNDHLYDPLTKAYMVDVQRKNALSLIENRYQAARKSGNLKNLLHTRLQHARKKKELLNGIVFQEELSIRKRFLQRIEAVCHWNPYDVDQLQKLYNVELKWQYFVYGAGISSISPSALNLDSGPLTIWLGNSDTSTNNHLDALAALAHLSHEDIEIICPLNYGDIAYGDLIEKKGNQLFGSKFKALRDYVNRDDYYAMMDRTRVAVLFHNRGQAGGNAIAFLKKGIKLYMKDESSIAQFFRTSGILIHSANSLEKASLQELKQADPAEQIDRNITLINEGIGNEQKRLAALSDLLLPAV